MAKEFRLQDPGEGIHEAEIVEVQVSDGDRVKDGDIVLVVETDKAAVEIPAPFTGRVDEVRVKPDQVVEVGDVLMTYTLEGEEEEERAEEAEEGGEGGEVAAQEEEAAQEEAAQAKKPAPEEEAAEEEEEPAPEAGPTQAKAEEGDEAEEREEGRAEEEKAPQAKERSKAEEEGGRPHAARTPVPASPSTRRLARELGVDLREVPGSGPGGRVTAEDVRGFSEKPAGEEAGGPGGRPERREREETEPEAAVAEEAAADEEETEGVAAGEAESADVESGAQRIPFRTLVQKLPPLPDFSTWGSIHREPLRRIRRTVARRMTMAWWEIPHVTHHEVADITEVERFRQEHEEAVSKEGGQLTLTVLVLKAAAAALKEHPRFNTSLDVEAEEIVFKDYCNIGLAVDTEQGLVVPVIRDVDRKSMTALSIEIPEVVRRVRAGDTTQEDVQGGTFTLTNPGPLGGTSFSPIVRYPEVAILGVAQARLEPVVVGDLDDYEIVPRLRLPLVLAFDHRVNDGADAARFMNTIVGVLSDTDALLLHI